MELKIQTKIGELTAVFEIESINCYQNSCARHEVKRPQEASTLVVAWFKQIPSIIVQADNINQAIDELIISLNYSIHYHHNESNPEAK